MIFALQLSVSFENSRGNCSKICKCISQIYAELYAQFSEIVGELCAHFSRIVDKFCAQFSKILRIVHCNFSEILWKFHCNFSKIRLQIGMNFAAISQKIAGSGDNTTPMQIRKTQPGTHLHRRCIIGGPCCGRAMLAPTQGYARIARALRDGSMWSSTPTGWVPLRGECRILCTDVRTYGTF